MLRVSGIDAYYGSSQALFGMELTVGAGEVVTLLGRNGMGKTTTINAIMGIVQARRGEVNFDGTDITGLASHRIARLGLGLVPEGRQVFPNLSVRENLMATARTNPSQGAPWSLERIFAMFPALEARREAMASLLSGGEQQMLAIGRALMTNPRLLILDEATEGLAPFIRAGIWECLARIKVENLSILVVDKNIHDLMKIADRHVIIEKGRAVWTGTNAALKADSGLLARYLGV